MSASVFGKIELPESVILLKCVSVVEFKGFDDFLKCRKMNQKGNLTVIHPKYMKIKAKDAPGLLRSPIC